MKQPITATKKPVDIQAIQFTGDVWPVLDFVGTQNAMITNTGGTLVIHTLEGDMTVSINDWVIKGVKGEFYPCKPDIFNETYTQVVDNE